MLSNVPWSFDLLSFLLGILMSGVLGFILGRIRAERGKMKAPDRPMAVYTTKTPNEVQKAASQAFWRYVRWMFALIISLIGTGWVLYWLSSI